MLKDITLGQFFPGESFIHRLDPRTKILSTIALVVLVFVISSPVAYVVYTIFIFLVILVSRVRMRFVFKGLKPLWFILLFTAMLNIFMTSGTTLYSFWIFTITYEGIYIAIKMVVRLALLVITTSILTFTTSPIMLTDGIEKLLGPFKKIGLPAHELAMMMTIAIRFIPTLIEETDKIMKAQAARGAGFDSGGLINRARALVPLLVPLFVSAFRRADELAIAMESRCYRGGENRTRMRELRYSKVDVFGAVYFLIFSGLVIAIEIIRF